MLTGGLAGEHACELNECGVKDAFTPGLELSLRWPVECFARGPIRHVSAVRLHNMTVILGYVD